MESNTVPGLEGVCVAETRLSDVRGGEGRLIIAGHDLEQLAARADFESALALLWNAGARLGQGRARAFARLPELGGALDHADGMDALRAAVGQLPSTVTADELCGAVAVFAAAWWRRRRGLEPLPPDPEASHAADYLRLCRGEPVPAGAARALDVYLVSVVDHGLNASTFAARVVASTGSDRVSAVCAAIGALKGPLHGGAPGPVLDMLDAVGEPSRARAWLEAEVGRGRRIMGMGHRVYRVRDPRAAVLEAALERLGHTERLALARAVEREAEALLAERHPGRPLRANVEFYTALLLDAVGLDRAQFSPTFAVGRVGGWLAHFDEQQRTGRLIRPSSKYVGALSGGSSAELGADPVG